MISSAEDRLATDTGIETVSHDNYSDNQRLLDVSEMKQGPPQKNGIVRSFFCTFTICQQNNGRGTFLTWGEMKRPSISYLFSSSMSVATRCQKLHQWLSRVWKEFERALYCVFPSFLLIINFGVLPVNSC